MLPRSERARDLGAVLLLLLLPAVLLGECLQPGVHYLPFDLAEFPPVATALSPEELAHLRENANYDATEPSIWWEPEFDLVHRGLDDGTFPHWNPYVRGGAPLVAHGHLGLFDPLHWPALLLDPRDGLLWLSWAALALAGVLMFGMLRELRLGRPAALFGAVTFTLSGTLAANAHWYMRAESIALLPGMVWALLRLDRTSGPARGLPAAGLALAVAMAWTAGFPPFAIVVCLFAGLVGAVLAVHRLRASGRPAALRLLLWTGAALLLGLLLAAVQVLPQMAFYPLANRAPSQTLADQSQFAFDPMGLLGYLCPEAFCDPGSRLLPGSQSPLAFLLFSRTEWGTGRVLRPDLNYNFTEYAVFAGTLPLLFAAVGLCWRGGPRWRLVCLALLLATFLLAVGPFPFHLAHALPGIQFVPPFRFAAPACAFLAALAALGLDRLAAGSAPRPLRAVALAAAVLGGACLWTSSALAADPDATERAWLEAITEHYRPHSRRFRADVPPEAVTPELVRDVFFTAHLPDGTPVDRLRLGRLRLEQGLDRAGVALLLGAAFAVLLSLRGRGRALPWWLAAAATAATAVELGLHGIPLNRGRELPHALDSPVHEFLREQRDAAAASGGFLVARANPGAGDAMHLPPGTLARERIRDLQFYTFLDGRSGLPVAAIYGQDFLRRDHIAQALPDDERLSLPLWDAMGLRYLLTTAPMQHAGIRVGPRLEGPGGEFFVYERPTALPRAWIVPELMVVADDAAAIAAAIRPDFEPRRRAIVTAATAGALPAPGGGDPGARTVTFLHEDLKRLTLQVGDGPPGYLVLADTCLPGWTVSIDGRPAPIAEANVYQRLVPLPAGACTLAFRYRTPGLLPGLAVSAVAAAVLGLLVALALRARRRRQPQGAPGARA